MRWLLLFLCGCNEGALSPNQMDASDFCGNPNSPRLMVNSRLSTSPAVMVTPQFLDCCEAESIQFVSMQLSNTLSLQWRVQVGSQPSVPATVDLAKLPQGWGVNLTSDCNQIGQCSDTLFDGMTGSLTVSGDFSAGFKTSACITANESSPHPVLHSVRLWLPTQ